MRPRTLACIVAVLMSSSATAVRSQTGQLTDEDVVVAIEAGRSGSGRGRALYGAFGDARIGAVAYSPAIRIAIAARKAAQRGKLFTLAQVPPAMKEGLVYVAMRALPHSPDYGVSMYDRQTIVFLDPAPSAVRLDPVWLSFKPLQVLASFGETLPYSDVALVAAFPHAAFQEGARITALRRLPENPQYHLAWTVIICGDDTRALR